MNTQQNLVRFTGGLILPQTLPPCAERLLPHLRDRVAFGMLELSPRTISVQTLVHRHLRSIVSLCPFHPAFGMEMGAFSLVFPYLSVSARIRGNRFALISGVFLGDSVSATY